VKEAQNARQGIEPRLTEAEEAEMQDLALLLAPRSVPTGLQARDDNNRICELWKYVMTPSAAPLSDAQRDELAELLARRAVYERSPEGVARARLYTLMFQSFEPEGLSPAELEEQAVLERRYPPLPVEPMFSEMVASRQGLNPRLKAGEDGAAFR
jgi:hypothetical protein